MNLQVDKRLLCHTYINGLGIVTKPVAKINTLHIGLAELAATANACDEQGQECIFNVTASKSEIYPEAKGNDSSPMSPIAAFSSGGGSNVSSTKGIGRSHKG